MSKVDIDQLSKIHVLWEWPEHTKKPNHVDQCRACLSNWPCETRQLIAMIKELRTDLEEAEERITFLQDQLTEKEEA